MKFAGIDFDTRRVDVVVLDADTLIPVRYLFELPGASAFDRARHVWRAIIAGVEWHRIGVAMVGIEQPVGQRRDAMYRMQGAILSCFPEEIPVVELPPYEWRTTLGLRGSGKRVDVKAQAVEWTRTQPMGERIVEWSQDAVDAYCIARATLDLCLRGRPVEGNGTVLH